jgi:hypothetical protein
MSLAYQFKSKATNLEHRPKGDIRAQTEFVCQIFGVAA